tara:strand:- start:1028 stop:1195 length:168 start_codon:yes stop_codon:yes gene_type:complete
MFLYYYITNINRPLYPGFSSAPMQVAAGSILASFPFIVIGVYIGAFTKLKLFKKK